MNLQPFQCFLYILVLLFYSPGFLPLFIFLSSNFQSQLVYLVLPCLKLAALKCYLSPLLGSLSTFQLFLCLITHIGSELGREIVLDPVICH